MSRRRPAHACPRSHRGVGLIEVLIALVVVSLGVLGVAGLQLTGMQHSAGGFNRSKATVYAEDMASRMRLNRPAFTAASGYPYDGHDSSAAGYCAAFAGPVCDARDGTAAARCNATQLAAFDLFSVSCGVVGSDGGNGGLAGVSGQGGQRGQHLPGGSLQVNCDGACAPDSTWTISVSWSEGNAVTRQDDVDDERQVRMRVRP